MKRFWPQKKDFIDVYFRRSSSGPGGISESGTVTVKMSIRPELFPFSWNGGPLRLNANAPVISESNYHLQHLEASNALHRSFRVQLVESPETVDEGGPFQRW